MRPLLPAPAEFELRRLPKIGGGDTGRVSRVEYSLLQAMAHWAIAFLCVVAFPSAGAIHKAHIGAVFGIRVGPVDRLMASAHEWGGWFVLALTLFLALSRLWEGAPLLPGGMSTWQRWAAHATHGAIYAGLMALVGSGAFAMYADGRLSFVHVALAQLGIGLIALHVAAVGWHQMIRRDGLLWRMLPRGGPQADWPGEP